MAEMRFWKKKPTTEVIEPPPVDLRAAERLTLPPNASFPNLLEAAERIQGMLSPFSMAIMDTLLDFQEALGVAGDILEIGILRGKSAALLGRKLREGERLTLVDVQNILDRVAIEPFKASTDFILSSSENLRSTLPRYEQRRGTFRFIHIDASHGFQETFAELKIAEELLGAGGIIAMDDFANLHYSQNIAAIFKYLFTTPSQLTPVVVTDEKAYLCRRQDFDKFARLVLETGLAEMQSRGAPSVLARTCLDPEYKALYLRSKQPGEESFYGESIYRNHIIG